MLLAPRFQFAREKGERVLRRPKYLDEAAREVARHYSNPDVRWFRRIDSNTKRSPDRASPIDPRLPPIRKGYPGYRLGFRGAKIDIEGSVDR